MKLIAKNTKNIILIAAQRNQNTLVHVQWMSYYSVLKYWPGKMGLLLHGQTSVEFTNGDREVEITEQIQFQQRRFTNIWPFKCRKSDGDLGISTLWLVKDCWLAIAIRFYTCIGVHWDQASEYLSISFFWCGSQLTYSKWGQNRGTSEKVYMVQRISNRELHWTSWPLSW